MTMNIKDKLIEIKEFKFTVENAKNFDALIESVKNNLPEVYRDKLNLLTFYEIYKPSRFDDVDDLPF